MAREDENNDVVITPPVQPTQQTPHTLSTIKLLILKKGEYDIWVIKMEHYLGHTNYPIWEVIQKGNGLVNVSTDTNGQIKVLPLKTAEEILARERERKARTTLHMAIPKDHLVKFHKMTDVKKMWEAIKSRFSGNDESKKTHKYIINQQFESFSVSNSEGLHKGYDRFQSLLSQLEIHGAGVSTEDANQKFLRSLPSSWSQVSLIMRTKPGVDSLSFDGLYNNLKVFEHDVKGSTASSSSSHNVAFVSSESTSSTNEVSTTYGVSTSSGHNSQKEGSSSYTNELIYSFFSNQSSGLQLDHEDLEHVDEFDLEKMNLKWQVAMISMRLKKSKGNQESRRRDAGNTEYKAKDNERRPEKKEEPKALVTLDGDGVDWTVHAEEDQMSAKDKSRLGYGDQIHEGVLSYEKEVFESVFDSRSSDVEDSHVYDRFAKVEGMHAVPPPITGNYMPPKFDFRIDYKETLESVPKSAVNEPKVISEPKVGLMLLSLRKGKGKGTSQKENRPVWNNVQRLNHQNKFVPKAVLTKTGRFPVNTARQNFSSQAAATSTARKVNTARPMVNDIRPRNNFYKSHSPIRRPFNRTTTPKANFTNYKVITAGDITVSVVGGNRETAVKASTGCNWRSKRYYWNKVSKYNSGSNSNKNVHDDPQKGLKNKGIVDSGCSRHITGKKAYLVKYQDYNGGPVAFGGKLKEFNLFSVSQMCDKKNKVLFTNSECLVMSPDVKLSNENQVLLRVPRQNKMYSFNLENIVPFRGLACLIAKAIVYESNKWHRRDIIELCGSKGIKSEYSNARTPQQNGVAERKNRTLIEATRTMLADSFLPNTFWAEAVSTACYVLNTSVTPENKANKTAGPKVANHSAGKKLKKDTGSKSNEKPVDQEEQAFLEELERLKRQEKEDDNAAEALRKEFAQDTKNLHLQARAARATSTNTVNTISTPVSTASSLRVFSAGESSYPDSTNYADQDDSQIPDLEDIYNNPSHGIFTNASYDDEGAVADFTNLENTMNVSPIPASRIHSIHPTTQILGDPTSTVQTRSKVNKSSGAHALEELLQFKIHKVWILVDLPYGNRAIGTKWVYRNKKDKRCVVVRNKARLVAQGYRQEEGIYYDEVFAHVARIEAIMICLAFASYMGFIVYQMDVKSAFLYGIIEEKVYVSQPLGFVDHKFPKKVYKVIKALYGLHQAPRAWYAIVSTFLVKSGYRRRTIDKTLFIKKDKKDIMLVKQKEDGIFISQDKYVAEILKKFDFASLKTASTPIETQKPLTKDEDVADVDVHLYRSMICSLTYLTTSRPDIMFVVYACSRFQVTPKTSHLHVVKRIFRYLKGKPKLGLWYPKVSSFDLEAYSDSDYAGENLDRKSTIGGCQFLGKRLISWQCKKQTIMATSTTEAEYIAAANCCGKLLWIQN
ncbi:putative ribonuclease H-like domain-containing protein [Tanacetum coccineum]